MTQQITVQNVTCMGCVNSIKKGLSKIEGVTQVEVDKDTQVVTVQGAVDKAQLVEKLSDLGYPEKA